jgi:hypothetical protein
VAIFKTYELLARHGDSHRYSQLLGRLSLGRLWFEDSSDIKIVGLPTQATSQAMLMHTAILAPWRQK